MFLQNIKVLIFKLFFLSLLWSCSSINETPPNNPIQIEFIKTFGGSNNESAKSITKTSDRGYAILGYTQSMDGDVINKVNNSYDYWLLKFDQNNNLQWQKTYGGSGDDRGNEVIQTTDGGYAILGYSQSNDGDMSENFGFSDYWVSKLDASGNILWKKSLGYAGTDTGISIIETNDLGFLLTGVLDVTASEGNGNSKNTKINHAGGDYWVIKLNISGEKQWSKYYGGSFTDTPYDVIQTEDNGYIIVGSSDSADVDISSNQGTYDFWVIKIDNTGTLVWEKSFGGSEIDEAFSIVKSSDGNYIIVGDTRSNDKDISQNNGASDLWVVKITPSGNLLWEKTFGGTSFDAGRSISNTSDNGFLISGSSRSMDGDLTTNQGQNDVWVLKIDFNGSLLWQKSFGGSNIDFAYGALELEDNSFIIIGESSSADKDIPENKGFTDLIIAKLK
ncbi:hypothetical protein V8G56_02575 [Gaetbulibacter aquiaggeris]|uniref:Bulb-type lectin domain-containing protein n=1 Tax=Gaetbulibacter aquiaggeris TaxID=1735373 RepID=A0ABW7MR06_9FLAO